MEAAGASVAELMAACALDDLTNLDTDDKIDGDSLRFIRSLFR